MLPSELKKGVVKRRAQHTKDWGECMLTFDKIKEPVKAADGHIYERWAIAKWLSENANRSPLTNQVGHLFIKGCYGSVKALSRLTNQVGRLFMAGLIYEQVEA